MAEMNNGADPNTVRVGALRWPVVIANREQAADPDSAGILERLSREQSIRADVQPAGPMTFYAAEQVDAPVTHRITTRWLDWVDTACVIMRATRRPDRTVMVERFRVRRVMPIDGRQRFLRMDCELEVRV